MSSLIQRFLEVSRVDLGEELQHLRAIFAVLFCLCNSCDELVRAQTNGLRGWLCDVEQLCASARHGACKCEDHVVGHHVVDAVVLLSGNLIAPPVQTAENGEFLLAQICGRSRQHLVPAAIALASLGVVDRVFVTLKRILFRALANIVNLVLFVVWDGEV